MRGSIQGSLWALALGGVGLSFASLVTTSPMQADAPLTPQLQVPQPMVAAPAPTGLASQTIESDNSFAQMAPQVEILAENETVPEVDTASVTAPPAPEAEMTSEAEAPAETDAEVRPADPIPDADMVAAPDASGEDNAEAVVANTSETAPEPVEQVIVTEEVVDEPQAVTSTAPAEEENASAETAMAETTMSEPETAEDMTQAPDAEDVIALLPEETAQTADTPLVSTTEPEATAAPLIVQSPVTAKEDDTAEADALPVAQTPVAQSEPEVATEPSPVETDTEPAPTAPVEAETAEAEAPRSGPVRVNRIGVTPSEPAGEDAVVIETDDGQEDIPPLSQFAVPFENPAELPLLSLVLIDDGALPNAVETLAGLGFTPTIVIDALSENAANRMAEYRAAGLEVALQISLPDGAQPADVEVAFAAAFDILPETVLLFSDGTGFLQGNRSAMSQTMAVLAAEGRGFVAIQRGLGSAVRDAQDAGVPAAAVARQIDEGGATRDAIGRALDQAAFRARQTGGAVLAGTVTPETLAALQEWAGGVDSDQLLIAPVSAQLLAQVE